MTLCKNCKHWRERETAFGICNRSLSQDGKALDETSLAFASDSDAWAARLLCKPDFGCIQWEAK